MNAALTERLVYVARAARDAGHGKRGAIYDAACAELGMSRATLLRRLKEVSVTDKRKKRADAGRSALTRDEAALISATLREATRKNGKRLYSIADAVETLRANGFSGLTALSPQAEQMKPPVSFSRCPKMPSAVPCVTMACTRNNWMPLHHILKWPVCIPIMSGRLMPRSARFTT